MNELTSCSLCLLISQDVSLGEHYPYAVSLPQNNTETAPPAIVFLGGKGSLFSEQDTQSRDTVVSFGGPGWNVMKYYNGSREDADVMAAERSVFPPHLSLPHGRRVSAADSASVPHSRPTDLSRLCPTW